MIVVILVEILLLFIKYAYIIDSERGTDYALVEREKGKDWFEEANTAIDKALFTLEQKNG